MFCHFFLHLFLYLCWALAAAHGICHLWLVGSHSLTKDCTWAPCIGSMESQPLDHWGSPKATVVIPILQM